MVSRRFCQFNFMIEMYGKKNEIPRYSGVAKLLNKDRRVTIIVLFNCIKKKKIF